jgi:hypothetical protein
LAKQAKTRNASNFKEICNLKKLSLPDILLSLNKHIWNDVQGNVSSNVFADPDPARNLNADLDPSRK